MIDLHMHTKRSDGNDTPEELLVKVRDTGIGIFSVTDHDTIAGSLAVERLMTGAEVEPRLIRGVEFSCKDGEGKYHILGYGYDPEHPALRETLAEVRGIRLAKAKGRVAFLKEQFGIVLPEDKLEWFYSLESPTKPVLGSLMADCGLAADQGEAISRYIDKYKHNFYLAPERAVAGIKAAGGVPVLAHPSFGDGSQYITGGAMEDRIRRLMGFGLEGLEVYYSEFGPELIGELLGYAEEYSLYVTAGSDYHGSDHHGDIAVTHLPGRDEWPAGLVRFLERMDCACEGKDQL